MWAASVKAHRKTIPFARLPKYAVLHRFLLLYFFLGEISIMNCELVFVGRRRRVRVK